MGIWDRLQRRADEIGEATVAVVGAGYVGTGVVHAIAQSPGMRPSLVVNRNTDRAVAALTQMGVDEDAILVSDDATDLAEAIRAGTPAVTPHAAIVAELPIEVVVEATGALNYGLSLIHI